MRLGLVRFLKKVRWMDVDNVEKVRFGRGKMKNQWGQTSLELVGTDLMGLVGLIWRRIKLAIHLISTSTFSEG